MKVIATKLGVYKGARRRPGTVFEMEDHLASKCGWVKPYDEASPPQKIKREDDTAAIRAAAGPKRTVPGLAVDEDLV